MSLFALGLASAFLYVKFFYLRFPLHAHYKEIADLPKLGGKDLTAAESYLGPLVALFVLYAAAAWLARDLKGRVPLAIVHVFALVFGAFAALEYPVTAVDIYVYLVNAREWVLHGANPLVQPPNVVQGDEIMHLAGQYANVPAPYGPVWIFLTGIPTRLVGDDLLANLLGLKLIALLCFLGCAWAVTWALRRLDPERAVLGTLLFAWNPLVIRDGIANGHNDTAMALPLVLGLGFAARGRVVPALALVALAGAVKYAALLALPILFLCFARRRPRQALLGGVVGVAVLAACYAPFWAGLATFNGLAKRDDILLGSVAAFLSVVRAQQHLDWIPMDAIKRGLPTLYAFFYGALLLLVWRGERGWVRAAFEALFWVLYVPTWFNSWFAIWPVALAALLPRTLAPWRAGVLSFTVLMGSFFFHFAGLWKSGTWDVHLAAIPALFGPPLLLSLVEAWRSRAPAQAEEDQREAPTVSAAANTAPRTAA